MNPQQKAIAVIINSQVGFTFCKNPNCKECKAVKSYKSRLIKDLADLYEAEDKKPKGSHLGEGEFGNIRYCDNCHYQVKPKNLCQCGFNKPRFLKIAKGEE